MRSSRAAYWALLLVVGCSGRIHIGIDLPDSGTSEDGATGSGGAGGTGTATGGGVASGGAGGDTTSGGSGGAAAGGTGGSTTSGGSGGAAGGGTGGSTTSGGSGGAGGGGTGGSTTSGGSGGAAGGGTGGSTTSGGSGGAAAGGTGGVGGAGTGVGGAGGASSGGTAGTGSSGASGAGGSDDAGAVPEFPEPAPCPQNSTWYVVGKWVGHIENYQFPSGSDLVTLNIDGANDTSLCGTMMFGSATPPSPPTNPDVVDYLQNTEGFVFALTQARVSRNVIEVFSDPGEFWKPWCRLQTSYPSGGAGSDNYRCVPRGAAQITLDGGVDGGNACAIVDPSDATPHRFDCGKVRACGGFAIQDAVCRCNAAGCNANITAGDELHLTFSGEEATGYVVFFRTGSRAYNVTLAKQYD